MTAEVEFTEPKPWPDPVLRERVARALSWHSDGQHRDDYQHFRGYWLGAADMALQVSGLADALAERDRARDVAVALEQEASVYGPMSRAFGDDPDGEHNDDAPTIDRNPAGELDRVLGQEAEQQDNDDAAHADLEAMRASGARPWTPPAPGWVFVGGERVEFNPREYANTPGSTSRRECPECCAELGRGEKHADDCDRAI